MWLEDVYRASQIVKRGRFRCVTHDGVAHADDTLAAALFYRAGAEFIYRYSSEEEILGVEGDVIVFDVGDEFRHRLPPRFVVLDHHGVADPAQEPSSVVQAALAVGAKFAPLVQTLVNFIDIYDRFGIHAKKWSGVFGNSLKYGLSMYFGDSTPMGLVKDEKFLALVADALYSTLDVELREFARAFKVAEKLRAAKFVDQFPRTFRFLKLILQAARDPVATSLSKEAVEAGFGIDFGAYALLAVPELEPYVVKGLNRYFADGEVAAEIAERGRYALIKGVVTAVVVEEVIRPRFLYDALLDLGILDGPTFVVVRDDRDPEAYVVWRPEEFAKELGFRRLQGDRITFKHPAGFVAVVKAENGEGAARYILSLLSSLVK